MKPQKKQVKQEGNNSEIFIATLLYKSVNVILVFHICCITSPFTLYSTCLSDPCDFLEYFFSCPAYYRQCRFDVSQKNLYQEGTIIRLCQQSVVCIHCCTCSYVLVLALPLVMVVLRMTQDGSSSGSNPGLTPPYRTELIDNLLHLRQILNPGGTTEKLSPGLINREIWLNF